MFLERESCLFLELVSTIAPALVNSDRLRSVVRIAIDSECSHFGGWQAGRSLVRTALVCFLGGDWIVEARVRAGEVAGDLS